MTFDPTYSRLEVASSADRMDSMTFVIDIDGPQRLKSTDFDDDLTFTTTWLTFVEVL